MKPHLFFIIWLLAVPLQAQQRHDAVLEEAQGPVKEIVYNSGKVTSVYFDRNGQETRVEEEKKNRRYDADGYLVAYETESLGILWAVTIDYDDRHREIRQTFVTNGGRFVNEITYGDDGQIATSVITISTNDLTYTFTSSFVYLTFDDRGNWLSRVRKRNRTVEYEERAIRYW